MLTLVNVRPLLATLTRPIVLVISAVILLSFMVACEAAPTPTPTAVPTATPTPIPTADPAVPSVLGADIMRLLPLEEVDCIQVAIGVDAYNLLLQTPFTAEMLTPEAAAASPVTACLSEESQAIFAQAVMGAGG